MLAGQNKKTYLIIGAAVLLILIAIVAVLLSLRKPAAEPQETLPSQEQGEESTYGTLPEIKPPELNPVEKTNPFKDVYKNPFGE